MGGDRTFRMGSHEAQALMRRGTMPTAWHGKDLVFPPAKDADSRRGLNVSGARHTVPDYIVTQHRYYRSRRFMGIWIALAALSLAGLLWYRDRESECVRQWLCYRDQWSGPDYFGLWAVIFGLGAALTFMVGNTLRRKAAEQEAAVIARERAAQREDRIADPTYVARWGD